MEAWQTILKAALLGADREAMAAPAAPGAIGPVVEAACASDAAMALLRSAAIVGIARQAGAKPLAVTASMPAAEPETLPACSAAASAHLGRMLGGEYRAALPEWLKAVAAGRQRIPHRWLSDVLELASEKRELRPLLRDAIGQRGAWLMRQNPAWQFDTLEDDATAWETGAREVRIAAFRRLRQADPAGARERLATSWAQETPEDRAQLIDCLAVGLGMSDESFLEAALDDRRKEVRKAAAELLIRLRESRLAARMKERLGRLVRVAVAEKRKLLGLGGKQRSIQIEVTLPEACDKAMVRDGIEPKPPAGTGEKAWWLQQVIAATPPDALEEGSVDELLEAAAKTEWALVLQRGWALAAARHRDGRWAGPMLTWQLSRRAENEQDPELVGQLASALSPAARSQAAQAALDGGQRLMSASVQALLLACEDWDEELTRAFVRAIRKAPRNDSYWVYRFRELVDDYGLRMRPALAAEVAAANESGDSGAWANAVEMLVGMVQFRKEMLEAIDASKEKT